MQYLEPDSLSPIWADVIAGRSKRVVVTTQSRRSGKTTAAIRLVVDYLRARPDARVAVSCTSEALSKAVAKRAMNDLGAQHSIWSMPVGAPSRGAFDLVVIDSPLPRHLPRRCDFATNWLDLGALCRLRPESACVLIGDEDDVVVEHVIRGKDRDKWEVHQFLAWTS